MKFIKRFFLFYFSFTLAGAPINLAFAKEKTQEQSQEQTKEAATEPLKETVKETKGNEGIPARTVFVEVEKIPDAAKYQVQVLPVDQSWADNLKLETESNKFRFRLTPGRYNFRVRSVDIKGRAGFWGDLVPFRVQFKSPSNMFPADNASIEAKGLDNEKITFEWPAVPGAKENIFKLKDNFGNVIKRVRTKQTFSTHEVAVDSSYSWSLTPLTEIGEPDPGTVDTWLKFTVTKATARVRSVYMELDRHRLAKGYQFEFVKFIDQDNTTEPSLFESVDPNFRARLGPGEYEMRARSVFDDGRFSDWSPPERFFVEMPEPRLIGPAGKAVVDSTDTLESVVILEWEHMTGVGKYVVAIYDKDTGKIIQTIDSDTNSVSVKLPHDAYYRWTVAAYNKREKIRAPASVNVKEGEEFGINRYVLLDLIEGEEPSQKYAWARYIMANERLESRNYEYNNIVRQTVFGGSGELAAGMWFRKSGYGMVAAVAGSGFRFRTETFTYNMASVMAGYRRLMENGARLRIWGGLGFKEVPEVQVHPITDEVTYSRVSTLGPDLRFSYIKELANRLGANVTGGLYYGSNRVKTPNDLKHYPQVSFHFGFGGTLRLNDSTIGTLGYTYQRERASYLATDRSGNNTLDMSGHFISLSVQFGLEKAQR